MSNSSSKTKLAALCDAVNWVLNDFAYKAPEQCDYEMAARWMDRLRTGLVDASNTDETPNARLQSEIDRLTRENVRLAGVTEEILRQLFELERSRATDPAQGQTPAREASTAPPPDNARAGQDSG